MNQIKKKERERERERDREEESMSLFKKRKKTQSVTMEIMCNQPGYKNTLSLSLFPFFPLLLIL